MWDSLQNILPKVAGKYHFAPSLNAIKICQEYRSITPHFLPENALKHTFPKSYAQQTLTIGVVNSAWAQQVQMNKHRIQQAINQKYGPHTIKKIRIDIVDQMPADVTTFT